MGQEPELRARRDEPAGDRALRVVLSACALTAGALLLLVATELARESAPAFRAISPARFLTDDGWHPAASAAEGRFDLVPMLVATALSTAGALLLAGPLGLACAAFGRFYAPRALRRPLSRALEVLAGIPSVVYGLWGLGVLVPLVRELAPPGPSLLAGVLVLALMVLPTVALLAAAALDGLPRDVLAGAAALGLSRRTTLLRVALPACRRAVAGALVLAGARAAGETMAILMVAGNVARVPGSPFDPVRTLTANIALELGYAAGDHRAALFASALLGLLAVALPVLLASRAAERSHRPHRIDREERA